MKTISMTSWNWRIHRFQGIHNSRIDSKYFYFLFFQILTSLSFQKKRIQFVTFYLHVIIEIILEIDQTRNTKQRLFCIYSFIACVSKYVSSYLLEKPLHNISSLFYFMDLAHYLTYENNEYITKESCLIVRL